MLAKMKAVLYGLLLPALVLAILAGCSGQKGTEIPTGSEQPRDTAAYASAAPSEEMPKASPAPSAEQPPISPAEPPVPSENGEAEPLRVSAPEDVQRELYDAIRKVEQPVPMDISGVALGEDADMAVKNLYYELTRQFPELKYAYDVSAAVEDSLLICHVSYMPYKTGEWPPAEDAVAVSSLGELLRTAEGHMGVEALPIRLTDPDLTPDDMNRVLRQAGGGYILCSLNRDGTEITYTPAMGMDMEECLSLLEQADALAGQVVAEVVTDAMTEREKAEALYAYLAENVTYDRRYYSDRENMPYDAQTAIGALRDGTAICGGYSHALKLLFEKAGIPCFNMTGKYFRENHMWSMAYLGGEWLWFDATSDRGVSAQFTPRHFAMKELDTAQYRWEPEDAERLLKLAEEYSSQD